MKRKSTRTTGRGSRGKREQWGWHRRALLALHRRLAADQKNLAEDVAAPREAFSSHPADAGTDEFDHELALGLLSAEENALLEVEAALGRIEAGTYGVCEITGRPIPKGRLRAVPWTRFTAPVQAVLEKSGIAAARQLGELKSVQGDGRERIDQTPSEGEEVEASDEHLSPARRWAGSSPGRKPARGSRPRRTQR